MADASDASFSFFLEVLSFAFRSLETVTGEDEKKKKGRERTRRGINETDALLAIVRAAFT